jgi:hypothetical protein
VGEDAGGRGEVGGLGGEEACDGVGGEAGHGGREQVAQFAVALLEADVIAGGGKVEGVEAVGAQRGAGRGRRGGAPEGGRGAVAKEAGADEYAGIVVEVKGGGADLDRDAGDGGFGPRGEEGGGGAEGGDGGTAAEADEILEKGVGAEAEGFGDVAGDTGAEVASAGADEEGIELVGVQAGAGEGGGEGAAGEGGCLAAKGRVERVGGGREKIFERGKREVAGGDSAVAPENGGEGEAGAAREARAGLRGFEEAPAVGLGEARGRDGGGEGVEIHRA